MRPLKASASNFIIGQASLIVTANNLNQAVRAGLPVLTVGYSGFVGSDNSASRDQQPTLTTTATAASHVAGNPLLRSRLPARADPNYAISYVAGSLAVTAGAADDHGRQSDQRLRRGIADAYRQCTRA